MRKGFTLVELSIVLIIVGLMIGGVMKGSDMINSAEQKKMYNTWIKGWQLAISQYQDRTGQILGDGIANGGANAGIDGIFDNINLSIVNTVATRLREVGLEVPITNTSTAANAGGSYIIKGRYTRGTSVMLLSNANINTNARNILQLTNIPADVALAIDTMIDGVADAGQGNCVLNTAVAAVAPAAAAWPAANTGVAAEELVTVFIIL
jgi:prepilin-type N-terminal cleavage/methylation domain-containing protein